MKTLIKVLIFTTIGASLIAGFVPQLYPWLTLSWAGLQQFYIWQLITYIFIERGPISFPFFLQLAFNMYILWMFGSSLLERAQTKKFLLLYFGSALISALTLFLFPYAILSGSINPIYALLTAWIVLNPHAQLLLFFSIPFKAEWLILSLIGITLLIDLSNAQWAMALSLSISAIYGYLFALIAWRQQGPFPFLHSFERKVLKLFEKRQKSQHKIYDIKSGSPILDDDQFMDEMLDRISRHGEDSLTPAEKKRMKEISEKRNGRN